MPLKVVFFYNGNADGWTETYYANSSDPFTFLSGVPTSVFTASTAFRAPNTDLFAVRATQLNTGVRLSWTLPLSGKFVSPLSPNQEGYLPDAPQVDALFNLYDGLGHVKKTYFRGLVDAQVAWTSAGVPIQNANLIKPIQQFVSQLAKYQFQLRTSVRPPTGGAIWLTVQSVSPATALGFPQFTFVQTTLPPNLPLTGTYPPIVFQGVNKNALPGFPTTTYGIAQSNTAPTYGFVIPYLYRNTTAFQPTKNMRCTVQVYQYQSIYNGVFLRFTNHKTGRNFGTPRGRARSVVRSN